MKAALIQYANKLLEEWLWLRDRREETWKGAAYDVWKAKHQSCEKHWRAIAEIITGERHDYQTLYEFDAKGERKE